MPLDRQYFIGRWQTAWARAGTEHLEPELRETGPEDTGELNRQTRVFPRGPFRVEAVVAVPYASFQREGTPPHEIRAVNAQVLRWVDAGGNVRFAKSVQHPGTQPNDWIERAAGKMGEWFVDELGKLP